MATLHTKVKKYLTSVKKEMSKVSWLNPQEMRGSTIVVVCFSIVMAVIVWGIDRIIFIIKRLF